MRKIFILALLFYVSHLFAAGDDPMVLVYKIDSVGTIIGIPVGGITPGGSVTINWGDGTDTTVSDTGFITHIFSGAGIDTVKISGGLTHFGFNSTSYVSIGRQLTSVLSWGDLPLKSLKCAFIKAENLTSVPATLSSTVTDLSWTFSNAQSFNGDVSNWDVSSVTNMQALFQQAESFNGDLSSWDVSSVTNMGSLFYGSSFNGDVSSWDVSNVTAMDWLFAASPFNGDVSNWDVSNVTSMWSTFESTSFNGDLSNWDVSKVTCMNNLFSESSFNGDLSSWDVSNAKQMRSMFYEAESFNGDLSSWDVSSVLFMEYMFWGAVSFNGNLSNWDITSVRTMNCMFKNATSFNCDLSNWNISNVNTMREIFDQTALSVLNYDNILHDWVKQPLKENGLLGAAGVYYSSDAIGARDSLKNIRQWVIEGDSLVETTFTVTYDENYPSGVATTIEQFSPVAKYVSPSYFPKREGYKLVGWNSKPDGSGFAFDNTIKITEDITFYAQWVKGTAIIQTDTTTLTGVKGLLVSPNPVPQSEEKVMLVIPSDLSGSWKIGVYDVLGNELDDATFETQGGITYEWDLRNKSGAKVGGGSYVIMAEHTDDSGNVKTFRRTVGVAR